jgi:hypothetical protein
VLDVRRVAELFGLPPEQIVPSQLTLYSRVARLRVLNPPASATHFQAWLNASNTELDELAPMELIRTGRICVVAQLVDDILVNRGR